MPLAGVLTVLGDQDRMGAHAYHPVELDEKHLTLASMVTSATFSTPRLAPLLLQHGDHG